MGQFNMIYMAFCVMIISTSVLLIYTMFINKVVINQANVAMNSVDYMRVHMNQLKDAFRAVKEIYVDYDSISIDNELAEMENSIESVNVLLENCCNMIDVVYHYSFIRNTRNYFLLRSAIRMTNLIDFELSRILTNMAYIQYFDVLKHSRYKSVDELFNELEEAFEE